MAALTLQHIVDAGTAPDFGTDTPTASDTAQIGNGLNTFVVYKNGSGAPITVTVLGQGETSYGEAMPNKVIAIPAGEERWIPLRKEYDDATGSATITTSDQTSLTVALVRLG